MGSPRFVLMCLFAAGFAMNQLIDFETMWS